MAAFLVYCELNKEKINFVFFFLLSAVEISAEVQVH